MNILELQERKQEKRRLWAYVVCFGTVITFIAGIGHVNSFGLIYREFITETNSSAKSLTLAHGVFAIMLALGGIILNIASKAISLRVGGLIGALIFCIGSFANIGITNTGQLSFTFGVLQGIGFGMMVPVTYSTINHYFVKDRTTVMSTLKAMQGFVLMWYPLFIKQILYNYGFRGTLLIICGISFHTLPGMIAMKINKPEGGHATRLKFTGKINHDADIEDGKLLQGTGHDNQNQNTKSTYCSIYSKLIETLNLKILKDPILCNICLGQSFVNFSDLTFFVLQPMLLFQYGYGTSEVAICISICAGADVSGRCLLALISSVIHINTRLMFYTATLLTFGFRLVILQVRDYVYVATVTGVLGVLRAWLHIASPLVISSHVSHEDFPGAYAIFTLVAGLVNVTCSPVIGLLKDVYKDYVPAFYALAVCCIPCLLTWPIEYFNKTY